MNYKNEKNNELFQDKDLPPCKAGDRIYILTTDSPTGIEENIISKIVLTQNSYKVCAPCLYDDWGSARWELKKKDFNVIWFLTREECKAVRDANRNI